MCCSCKSNIATSCREVFQQCYLISSNYNRYYCASQLIPKQKSSPRPQRLFPHNAGFLAAVFLFLCINSACSQSLL